MKQNSLESLDNLKSYSNCIIYQIIICKKKDLEKNYFQGFEGRAVVRNIRFSKYSQLLNMLCKRR